MRTDRHRRQRRRWEAIGSPACSALAASSAKLRKLRVEPCRISSPSGPSSAARAASRRPCSSESVWRAASAVSRSVSRSVSIASTVGGRDSLECPSCAPRCRRARASTRFRLARGSDLAFELAPSCLLLEPGRCRAVAVGLPHQTRPSAKARHSRLTSRWPCRSIRLQTVGIGLVDQTHLGEPPVQCSRTASRPCSASGWMPSGNGRAPPTACTAEWP